ncbi:MAG: transposase, partial [Actinobacteria bacterium]|nr:transposase [Actinomycetota bacterium]
RHVEGVIGNVAMTCRFGISRQEYQQVSRTLIILIHGLDVTRAGVLVDEMWARIKPLLPSSGRLRAGGEAITAG